MIVIAGEEVSEREPLYGVVASMAWKFTGDRLRIVWFRYTDGLHYDIENAVPLNTKQFMTYAQTKQVNAVKARALRARLARERRARQRAMA